MPELYRTLEYKKYFTVTETAQLLDVAITTVHYWIKQAWVREFERTSKKGHYRLPRREVVLLLKERNREVPGIGTRPPKAKSVLILEDSKPRADILELTISKDPRYKVKVAYGAVTGAALATKMHPDAIVADLGLGPIRSDKTIRELKKLRVTNGSKFLFYSARLKNHLSKDPHLIERLKKDLGAEVMEWPDKQAVKQIKAKLDSLFPEVERRGNREVWGRSLG